MIRKLFIIAGIVAMSPLAFACTEHERVSYTEEAPDNTPINTSYESESSVPEETNFETTTTVVEPDMYYSNGGWYYRTYARHLADKPAVNSRMINEEAQRE